MCTCSQDPFVVAACYSTTERGDSFLLGDLLLGAVLHRGKATGILQWTGDLVTLADRPSRGCSRQHAWVINVSGCLPLATAAGVGEGGQFACICLESEGN